MSAAAPFEDYYAVLEVHPAADEAAIRSAYKRLAMLKHPYKNPQDPHATEAFQLVHIHLEPVLSALTNRLRSSAQLTRHS